MKYPDSEFKKFRTNINDNSHINIQSKNNNFVRKFKNKNQDFKIIEVSIPKMSRSVFLETLESELQNTVNKGLLNKIYGYQYRFSINIPYSPFSYKHNSENLSKIEKIKNHIEYANDNILIIIDLLNSQNIRDFSYIYEVAKENPKNLCFITFSRHKVDNNNSTNFIPKTYEELSISQSNIYTEHISEYEDKYMEKITNKLNNNNKTYPDESVDKILDEIIPKPITIVQSEKTEKQQKISKVPSKNWGIPAAFDDAMGKSEVRHRVFVFKLFYKGDSETLRYQPVQRSWNSIDIDEIDGFSIKKDFTIPDGLDDDKIEEKVNKKFESWKDNHTKYIKQLKKELDSKNNKIESKIINKQ